MGAIKLIFSQFLQVPRGAGVIHISIQILKNVIITAPQCECILNTTIMNSLYHEDKNADMSSCDIHKDVYGRGMYEQAVGLITGTSYLGPPPSRPYLVTDWFSPPSIYLYISVATRAGLTRQWKGYSLLIPQICLLYSDYDRGGGGLAPPCWQPVSQQPNRDCFWIFIHTHYDILYSPGKLIPANLFLIWLGDSNRVVTRGKPSPPQV